MRGLSVFSVVLMTSLSVSAWAQDDCKIFEDVHDDYSLGPIGIGVPQLTFMSLQEAKNCYSQSEIEGECVYVDKSGLLYDLDLLNGSIEHSAVVQARLDDIDSYHGPFIAGIELGDSVDTVRHKLKSLPQDFPQWKLEPQTEFRPAILTTGNCLRSSHGSIWSYGLAFQDDRLTDVWAMEDGYESSAD